MLVPLIDRIIADKPIVVPQPESIPVFLLDFIYRINAMPRLVMLNWIIGIAVALTLFKAFFQYSILLAALHRAGLATLTHTPSPMKFLNEILGRPSNEKPFLLLVVGYPQPGATVPDIRRKALSEVVTMLGRAPGL